MGSWDYAARNLDDLRRLVQDLTGRGVRVQFVKEQLTFTGEDSRMASLLLSVMGERNILGKATPLAPRPQPDTGPMPLAA